MSSSLIKMQGKGGFCGYEATPRRRKSEVEIELERTRYELEQERMKIRVLTEAINGAGR